MIIIIYYYYQIYNLFYIIYSNTGVTTIPRQSR